ncbi:MAG: stage sporulation protein [Clostridia bacterium]|jgi:stage III sporulation protein AG|nr:stage sporulation protein [Clostridia bacterium]MDN5323050.1 stage sporulation protein [Clostridia bacterium]
MGDLIKSLFPEDKSKSGLKVNGKQRRYIIWLVLVAVLGIATMSFGDLVSSKKQSQINAVMENKNLENSQTEIISSLALTEKQMEKSLATILSQIAGVGEVAVNLTLESSPEYKYALNQKVDKTIVTEKAQDGSTRSTDEIREDAQVVMKNMTQGKDEPVIIKEIRPQVVGVMVVAQGASDLIIRERISEAVQTLLNIPAHRVTVLPKGK